MGNETWKTAYDNLSAKRRRFVDEYIVDENGTQAAIRAGYSGNNAKSQAARLYAKATIRAVIDAKLAEISEKCTKKAEIDAQWVLDKSVKLAEMCMSDIPVLDKKGEKTGEYRVDSSGANGSLNRIAKYFDMDKTTVEHSGSISVEQDLSKLTTEELQKLLELSKKMSGDK